MADDGSVTRWLDGMKEGDDDDIQRLWDRYFEKIVRLARGKLPGHARRAYDEEDVALSAFQSFVARAGQGQFPELADRDDLWKVLFTITARKVVAVVRHQTRLKRGGGKVLGESALMSADDHEGPGIAQVLSEDPTPEVAAQFAEAYANLLGGLTDATLREIAERKLDGLTSAKIAAELGVSTRTVDRKVQLIRALWEQGLGE